MRAGTRIALLSVALLGSVFFGCRTASPPEPTRGPRLLHLGNEGFLIEGDGKRVLIDALQGPGIPGYVTLPMPERARLERASPPYDGADLVLATHRHGDHFHPQAVGRYLKRAPGALFVSTEQAVERLHLEFADFEAIRQRVLGLDPPEGSPAKVEHAGLTLQVLNLHHGRGREVKNLGFVFDVGGLRFLHVGDSAVTPAELEAYGVKGLEIDVALLPTWFVTSSSWPQYRSAIGAERTVVMHIAAADAPERYFGRRAKTREELLDWFRRERPEAMPFWEPMQSSVLELSVPRPAVR